jgi:hypothetical protein
MHLLIGLDEDDDRTLAASDAADGGDLDDVVEVLTTGGMRKAHHFVGVHWLPRTRIVAFGPVAAMVTLADGSEHDVRAPSARVWTDLELPEHPERVVLRVLEEAERSQPVPPQHLVAGLPVGAPAVPSADTTGEPGAASDASAAAPSDATAQADSAQTDSAQADSAQRYSAQEDSALAPLPDEAPADESRGVAPAAEATATESAPTVEAPPAPATPAQAPAIPTFGATAAGDGASAAASSGSSWGLSWARRDTQSAAAQTAAVQALEPGSASAPAASSPENPNVAVSQEVPPKTTEASAAPPASAPDSPAALATPALRSWGSVAPAVPVRATTPKQPLGESASPTDESAAPASEPEPAQAQPAPVVRSEPLAAPVAADLPSVPQRDVDSTWAARPVPDGDASPSHASPDRSAAPTPAALTPAAPAAPTSPDGARHVPDADDTDPVAPPSYDYLFGHTTAADEHRKVLAQLTQPSDEDGPHEDDDVLSVPAVADTSDAAVTNAAPAPEVPERPIPSAPQVPEGGLISSVPWASPSATPATPKPEAEVPTFSGRHTPPPAPSLLPPVNTPPPGVRAPEATPLISTGPPPATRPVQPEPSHAAPHATPVLRTPPTVPIATTPPAPTPPAPTAHPAAQPAPAGTEPSFDVPLAGAPSASDPAPATPVSASVPGPVAVPVDDDETELTVDRSALLEARNAAQNQTFSGPSVLAVLCSAGHPTPPHGDRCRVCGTGIPPQEPFTMPRPPLGVLRLSTGDVVTLDRSVLLGRAPKLGEGLAAHDRPHVVKVPSPERDVSRNHVEVILEGWHVLIRDLGTTNGTTVALPGEAPVRLRANDQQVLEPGSLVSMADEVSFTFEAAS